MRAFLSLQFFTVRSIRTASLTVEVAVLINENSSVTDTADDSNDMAGFVCEPRIVTRNWRASPRM